MSKSLATLREKIDGKKTYYKEHHRGGAAGCGATGPIYIDVVELLYEAIAAQDAAIEAQAEEIKQLRGLIHSGQAGSGM